MLLKRQILALSLLASFSSVFSADFNDSDSDSELPTTFKLAQMPRATKPAISSTVISCFSNANQPIGMISAGAGSAFSPVKLSSSVSPLSYASTDISPSPVTKPKSRPCFKNNSLKAVRKHLGLQSPFTYLSLEQVVTFRKIVQDMQKHNESRPAPANGRLDI